MQHISVLQTEALDLLQIDPTDTIVDCTLGSGGHAGAILSHLQGGTFVGIDVDPGAIRDNQALTENTRNTVHLVNGNFRNIRDLLVGKGIEEVDGILADLGWRMEQFAAGNRGFSFAKDEPLYMTLGDPNTYSFTAYDIINEWKEEDIANVIYAYGEERASRRIAKAIVTERANAPISTSLQLAELVKAAVPPPARYGKIHPATRTFQALRIAVNDEFSALEELLHHGYDLLAPEGHMAIISFHSLEDRIVKHTFQKLTHDLDAVIVTKKPVTASPQEQAENPRARSAKLRVIKKP